MVKQPLTGAAYQRRNDAIARRGAEHFKNAPHVPGPRVDLPGQLDLPDTGPDHAGLAKLRAAGPLRPTAPQQPCDTGLFGDQPKQIDLEDLL